MEITPIIITIWTIAILIINLDIVILIGSKDLSSRVFALFSFVTALWVLSQGFLISTADPITADFLMRTQYLLGIIIALGFYYFSIIYPNDIIPSKKSVALSVIAVTIFAYLYYFTDTFISGVYQIASLGRWAWTFGPWNFVFDVSFYLLWTISLYHLFNSYRVANDKSKSNLRNMFIALLLGIIPPTMANIFLPSLGEYRLNWAGPIFGAIWIFIVAYSIARYRQMNVQIAIAKVLIISMATMSVINIFTDYIFGIYGRIILFIAVTTLCYFLYKSVTNGIKQTAQLTTLNSTLAEKVAEQTAEIRKAYELEKHARRDLEKLNETKDQFIMITQHHLRAPVTRIKNDLAATLSGDNGRLSAKLTRSLEDTDATATRLSKIVDDFLDITTLKVGSQILNIGTGNLGLLTEDVLDELRIDIEKMHLTVENGKPNIWPDLQIDAHKMREVLLIILENAIKYNVDGGTIEVTTDSRDGYFEIVVKNTGIGLTSLDREKLFKKNYYRSAAAMTVNPRGMGIGLSVARAIVRAHKGELTIGSEGLHKGVKVVVGVAV